MTIYDYLWLLLDTISTYDGDDPSSSW
jgi:hypothetical protein